MIYQKYIEEVYCNAVQRPFTAGLDFVLLRQKLIKKAQQFNTAEFFYLVCKACRNNV